MGLLTEQQLTRLRANGVQCARDPAFDPLPVAKAYTPDGRVVWLLAYAYPDEPARLHALCDGGTGFPALIDIWLAELETMRGPRGLPVAMDATFEATRTLSAYAALACAEGAYVED
ncbi:DUF2958 domain-containing protein [Achromobacter sp. F4_2707]|uniref:DUF2958 domain-containing protein n=1 Tax=Achromobacter sp. F4_2707 TaxID=3114286 RepID=UPI0039C6A7C8